MERGYYSERDAAHVIKQILEAVAVRPNESLDIIMCIPLVLIGNNGNVGI